MLHMGILFGVNQPSYTGTGIPAVFVLNDYMGL